MRDNGDKLVVDPYICRICGDEVIYPIKKKVHNFFASLINAAYIGITVCKKKSCMESDKLPPAVRLLWQTQEAAELFDGRVI